MCGSRTQYMILQNDDNMYWMEQHTLSCGKRDRGYRKIKQKVSHTNVFKTVIAILYLQ